MSSSVMDTILTTKAEWPLQEFQKRNKFNRIHLFCGSSSVHATQSPADEAHTLHHLSPGEIPAEAYLIPKFLFLTKINARAVNHVTYFLCHYFVWKEYVEEISDEET